MTNNEQHHGQNDGQHDQKDRQEGQHDSRQHGGCGQQPQAEEFFQRLSALLESSPLSNLRAGLREVGQDGGDNLKALGEALLGKMNVVSREEFEAQNRVLAQAVAKLDEIEALLKELRAAQKK